MKLFGVGFFLIVCMFFVFLFHVESIYEELDLQNTIRREMFDEEQRSSCAFGVSFQQEGSGIVITNNQESKIDVVSEIGGVENGGVSCELSWNLSSEMAESWGTEFIEQRIAPGSTGYVNIGMSGDFSSGSFWVDCVKNGYRSYSVECDGYFTSKIDG